MSPILCETSRSRPQYREKKKLKSVCAICFTGANETYHHWRVFSHGNSGVCVTFVFDKLCAHLGKDPGIAAGEVKYHRIDALEAKPPKIDSLPFVKRYPYRDEREYRFVYSDAIDKIQFKRIAVPLSSVFKVTLSPWLPKVQFDSIKSAIRSVKDCEKIVVRRTGMLETERWKRIAEKIRR